MSISSAIAPHLPYLRRFARMLSGSQKAGDAYVVATLESLVAAPDAFDRSVAPADRSLSPVSRHLEFRQRQRRRRPDRTVVSSGRSGRLRRAPVRRSFWRPWNPSASTRSRRSCARTPEAVRDLLTEASREIATSIATDVLIIEDEPIIAMDLESLVESLGHRVSAVARTPPRGGGGGRAAEARPRARRCPTRRRQLGSRRGQRDPGGLRRAGDLRHGLSGASADRGAAGADLPDHQAVPDRDPAVPSSTRRCSSIPAPILRTPPPAEVTRPASG